MLCYGLRHVFKVVLTGLSLLISSCSSPELISEIDKSSSFWIYCNSETIIENGKTLPGPSGTKIYVNPVLKRIYMFSGETILYEEFVDDSRPPEPGSIEFVFDSWVKVDENGISAGGWQREVPFGPLVDIEQFRLDYKSLSVSNEGEKIVCIKAKPDNLVQDGVSVKIQGGRSAWSMQTGAIDSGYVGDPYFDKEGTLKDCTKTVRMKYDTNGVPLYPVRIGQGPPEMKIDGEWVPVDPERCQ
jgi:hypothetical protein